MSLTFHSKVMNGKLICSVSDQIRDALYKFDNGYVKVTLDTVTNRRSKKQNAYKWSVVVETVRKALAEDGQIYSKDEVNDIIKTGVLGLSKGVLMPDGRTITIPGDMKDGNTKIWEGQMEQIRAYFAEYTIFIPLPNEIIKE